MGVLRRMCQQYCHTGGSFNFSAQSFVQVYVSQLTVRGEVLPYMGYIGMCGPKGYGFSAVLVINTL